MNVPRRPNSAIPHLGGWRLNVGALRFVLVNGFSFVKRFFYFDSTLYNIVVVLPLLAIAGTSYSKRGVLLVTAFACYYAVLGKHMFPSYFIPLFVLLICLPLFRRMDFEDVLRASLPFFWISALYGIYQRVAGYSSIEAAWIDSGLGVVGADNYYLTDDIRPFSFFAGVPEFGFFVVCYFFYFYVRRQLICAGFAAIMLFVIGSRGLMVGVAIALLVLLLRKRHGSAGAYAVVGVLLGLSTYLALAILLPHVVDLEPTSRVLLYGTFNARVLAAVEFVGSVTFANLWFGVGHAFSEGLIPDSLYINFLNNVGLIGLAGFLFFMIRECKTERQLFFLIVLLTYGFFAGIIQSFYLMFNFFLAYYASTPPGTSRSIENTRSSGLSPGFAPSQAR